jgi:hypothetical protein
MDTNKLNEKILELANYTNAYNVDQTNPIDEYQTKICNIKILLPADGFNPNDYFYHGTSSIYFPYIKRDGLGKFPDEIYDILERIYNCSRDHKFPETDRKNKFIIGSPMYEYPDDGVSHTFTLKDGTIQKVYSAKYTDRESLYENQREFRGKSIYGKSYSISGTWFTHNFSFASGYGKNNIGEIPSNLLKQLKKWKNDNIESNECYKDVNDLIEIFDPPTKKQIIIAFRKDLWVTSSNPYLPFNENFTGPINYQFKPSELFVYNFGDISTCNGTSVTPLLDFSL